MERTRGEKLFATQLGRGPLSGGQDPGNFYRLPPFHRPKKFFFRNTAGVQAFDVYNHILEIKTRTNMVVLKVVFLKIR